MAQKSFIIFFLEQVSPETHDYNGKRYVLEFMDKTWADAEADCVGRGGHLASIQSDAEALAIDGIVNQR